MKKKKEFITVARFRIFELVPQGATSPLGHDGGDERLVPVGTYFTTFATEEEAEQELLQLAKDSDGWDVGVGTHYVILRTLEIRTTI